MSRYDLPEEIRIEGAGPVRTVVLTRPAHRNAINASLHEALGEVWSQLRSDGEVSVVVITGDPEGRAFSAGGDMEMIERCAEDATYRYETMWHARRIVTEMMSFPLPVVAAVNGPAVGLGCSVALLSDIVVMSERSFFSDPHVLLGNRIDAVVAEQLGLANHVVPPEEVMPTAYALADRLAAQPQQALRDSKRAFNIHLSRSVSNVMDFAFSAEAETFTLPAFRTTLDRYREQ
jgi:enoyl-CoA hydratase